MIHKQRIGRAIRDPIDPPLILEMEAGCLNYIGSSVWRKPKTFIEKIKGFFDKITIFNSKYDTQKPPSLVSQGVQNSIAAEWVISSKNNAKELEKDGFISNGYDLGMKVGDFINHLNLKNNVVERLKVVSTHPKNGSVNLKIFNEKGGNNE
jgi:hypothetical protein